MTTWSAKSPFLNEASEKIGISTRTLWELLRGRPGVAWRTLWKIHTWLRDDESEALLRCAMEGWQRGRWASYKQYVDDELDRLQTGRGDGHYVPTPPALRDEIEGFKDYILNLGLYPYRAHLGVLRAVGSLLSFWEMGEGLEEEELVTLARAGLRHERRLVKAEAKVLMADDKPSDSRGSPRSSSKRRP